jgi:V/A-type H+/Na+-transporting ATPase subunit I
LYAVGLSSAILANLATDTAWDLGMATGPVGIILGILVATVIHLFAIVFTIIGHVLQPLRLHYAEFFTKFGFYEASGRPYKPFARTASENAGGN